MNIKPTCTGYIEDEADALLILQAVLDGKLNHIPRRPYEIERPFLIVSGNIFVFIEEVSGIKRWTDGVSWSPSRITGKFLIYRELNKRNTTTPTIKLPPLISTTTPPSKPSRYTGFVKKTISLSLLQSKYQTEETLHIVSYYNLDDVKYAKLSKPKEDPYYKDIIPCIDLITSMENTTLGNYSKANFSNHKAVLPVTNHYFPQINPIPTPSSSSSMITIPTSYYLSENQSSNNIANNIANTIANTHFINNGISKYSISKNNYIKTIPNHKSISSYLSTNLSLSTPTLYHHHSTDFTFSQPTITYHHHHHQQQPLTRNANSQPSNTTTTTTTTTTSEIISEKITKS
ncbi:hypothetical protein TBLA_0J01700 [Henningerozyma blattae CBS 6284]|uniref:Uncharacterized protein n=1 Tax=Henningerozyma blattae (strain ATCC 34711 / CBS 6284 / DSM 70876 / NBRC 10599 / NRRL Y-10934 / UCD 77-7) TaxID=1071380 RepID=I2H9W2_HENB6|nr:hypothetical protein TBLA_0J01700 [Tetrapisispora blattae CBS 6284]CCH63164.1 hypothetical protein TBLA_0J01700 [Tetrapisispora blattae CBS 6284]